MNSQVIRGISKVIGTTLMKYKDPQSQQLVNNLIIEMAKTHPDHTLEHFNAFFKTLCSKDLVIAPADKSSATAVIALVWANSVALHANEDSSIGKTELPKLMEYQSLLYALVIKSNNEKVTEKAYSSIKSFWLKRSDDFVQKYFDKFIAMDPACNVITFLSALLKFYQEEKLDDLHLQTNKVKLLEHFVKGLISVKVKPSYHHITACKILLNSATKDDVETILLPAMQRSVLRNPEIVLEGIGYIVRELNVNINEASVDLGKIIIKNMYSKNEVIRMESVDSLKEIVKKCSDAKVIETLLAQIFSVLGGSDGKIIVAEYRINLLQVF